MSVRYRLGSNKLFERPNEGLTKPKRVVFISAEGTSTEVCYFTYIEKYREQLGIDALVHIEVLRKYDTNSDPQNVLELLEEYEQLRGNRLFKKQLDELELEGYSSEFIGSYLNDPHSLPDKERRQFEGVLRVKQVALLYLDFLSRYHGEDDVFAIVIDRDRNSGNIKSDMARINQIINVIGKCEEKGYQCYITNPCFEFWLLLHISDVATEYADQLDDFLDNIVDAQKNSFVSNLLCKKTGNRKNIQQKVFEQYYLPNVDVAIDRAKRFASKDELMDKIGSNIGELFELLRN